MINKEKIERYRLSVAPMIDATDRHCRYFYRLLAPDVRLFTEMITTGAILYGRGDYLSYDPSEHPIVIQLGGSDPNALALATQRCIEYDYDEINLNVGCPSDRVQSGEFGACLMAKPQRVAQCIDAMQQVTQAPVSVKTRIGIDDQDSYEFLANFIHTVAATGCTQFYIHARKAWLQGLSPKQNREIPPLCYERVYQLQQDFPALQFDLNGGLTTTAQVLDQKQHVSGIMIGRGIYQNPYWLTELQQLIQPDYCPPSRKDIIQKMMIYIEKRQQEGHKFWSLVRHMLPLFHGQPGAKYWRRYLTEQGQQPTATAQLLTHFLD